MPYRRLPNTDQARIRAIRTAISKANKESFNNQVLEFHTLNNARSFIALFETQVNQYHQNNNSRIDANKDYKHIVNNARMYISHFIQTLNMAIARNEITAETRELYGLPLTSSRVPDLTTEEEILEWGQKIIDGEFKRTNGGFMGYKLQNPPIALVKVHFEKFRYQQPMHNIFRNNYNRDINNMANMRVKADALILEIWNQVEDYYRDCKPYERLCKCQSYGLIYYYRTGEKHLSPETDRAIEETIEQSPTIRFNTQTVE